MSWTVERLVELERRAGSGESADQIAAALGLEAAQVEGKAFRIGLRLGEAAREKPSSAGPSAKIPRAATPPAAEPIDVGSPRDGWSDARTDALRRLVATGLSASEIARTLGGLTRNAVIGRAARLGIRLNPQPASKPKKARGLALASPRPLSSPKPKTSRSAPVAPPPSLASAKARALARAMPRPSPARTARPAESAVALRRAADHAAASVEAKAMAAEGRFPDRAPLAELESGSCRYPLWGDALAPEAERFYCGAPSLAPSPYCRAHRALCTQSPAPRPARAAA